MFVNLFDAIMVNQSQQQTQSIVDPIIQYVQKQSTSGVFKSCVFSTTLTPAACSQEQF
jgi:hypothetical protein